MLANFISWADTSRGLSPAIAPFIDRTLLRPQDPSTPKFHHVEHDPSPVLKSASKSQSDNHKPSIVSTFKLTADQLNTLKAKANVANANGGKKHTTFNILATHIWRCVSKARGLSADQDTKLFFSVDGRNRLDPPLRPGYFGNVTFRHARIAQAGDLKTESFTDTIKRIHADFGWSRPIYMGPGNVVQEGKMYILASPVNDGSLSLATRLETPHMKAFEKL
ncbi:hypothetical protein Goshw_007207, partial [Gossypium schwendimanii]|nr:hypothetical protein [Gossypium schwendimanii]